jgi:hypothetical protein
MRMMRRLRLPATLIVSTLSAGGCGGGSPSTVADAASRDAAVQDAANADAVPADATLADALADALADTDADADAAPASIDADSTDVPFHPTDA